MVLGTGSCPATTKLVGEVRENSRELLWNPPLVMMCVHCTSPDGTIEYGLPIGDPIHVEAPDMNGIGVRSVLKTADTIAHGHPNCMLLRSE